MRHLGAKLLLGTLLASAGAARAQDDTTTTTDPAAATTDEETPESRAKNALDDTPMPSARVSGLAGAAVTGVDDLDAAWFNPAGIGGLNLGKKSGPFIRKLYFPWASLSATSASQKLNSEFRSEGGAGDSAIGRAIIDAHAGERQYARAAIGSGMVFGRTMVLPFNDLQCAASSQGDGSNMVDLRYRNLSGVGGGFSAQTEDGAFSLGYFGFSATRDEVSGAFNYDDIINADQRKVVIKENTTKYSATGHNAGIIWRLAKTGSPTLGVAVRNAGGTKWRVKSGDGDELEDKQDLNIGFSAGPQVGKEGSLKVALQANRLTDDTVSFVKKYHVGLELNLGGFGSHATLGLRAGASYAGAAGGLLLNLGLIGVEAAVESVDIGVGNEKVIERRATATVFVNLSEF